MSIRSFVGSALVACSLAPTPSWSQAGHFPGRLVSGTAYESSSTVTSSQTSGIGLTIRQRRIEAVGKLRMETLEITGPSAAAAMSNPLARGPGTYIVSGGDGHIYSVDTVKHEYFEIDPRQIFAKGSEMMKTFEAMNLKISDQKIDAKDMGNGDEILGLSTSHWRLSQSMTMTASMLADSMAMTGETTTDMYFARDLKSATAASLADSALMKAALAIPQFGDVKKAAEAYAKLPKKVLLKSVQSMVVTFGPMEVTTTTTTQVTKVEQKEFSESLFRVPTGFKRVDFPKMPAMPSAER